MTTEPTRNPGNESTQMPGYHPHQPNRDSSADRGHRAYEMEKVGPSRNKGSESGQRP